MAYNSIFHPCSMKTLYSWKMGTMLRGGITVLANAVAKWQSVCPACASQAPGSIPELRWGRMFEKEKEVTAQGEA